MNRQTLTTALKLLRARRRRMSLAEGQISFATFTRGVAGARQRLAGHLIYLLSAWCLKGGGRSVAGNSQADLFLAFWPVTRYAVTRYTKSDSHGAGS
jgi:hypothetical protein